MDTYIFSHTSEVDGATRTTTTEVTSDFVTHINLTDRFTEFLRGCGYVIDAYETLGLVEAP